MIEIIGMSSSILEDYCEMTSRRFSYLGLQWVAASAFGALLGGGLATYILPDLSFSQHRADEFTDQHILFGATIGCLFALSQSVMLSFLARISAVSLGRLFGTWTVVSTIGFAAMIIPLWYVDPFSIIFLTLTGLVFLPMLPGMAILAVAQCYVLQEEFSADLTWIVRTMIGAAIGGWLGTVVFFAFAFAAIDIGTGVDAIMAALIGASIGLAQVDVLRKTLENAPTKN